MLAPYCKWQDQRLCIKMEVMQCDICQGGLESIYLQKRKALNWKMKGQDGPSFCWRENINSEVGSAR